MLRHLQDALLRFVDDQTVTHEERKQLVEAGLITRTGGYTITELGCLRRQIETAPPGTVTPVTKKELDDIVTGNPALWNTQTPEQSAKDVQIGGDHYKKLGHHQPWEVLATWMTPEELRGYMKGTVIAYLAREQEKGKDQDIEKALHTMQLWQDVRKDK